MLNDEEDGLEALNAAMASGACQLGAAAAAAACSCSGRCQLWDMRLGRVVDCGRIYSDPACPPPAGPHFLLAI